VNYDELINLDNYSSVPKLIVALDQTMQTQNLQVPYALEFSLGYTRNFDTGFVKFAVVKRDYRKDWVAFVHQGMYDPSDPARYLTLVNNPVTGQPFSWSQSQLFINSDQHRDYEDAEVSWSERITQRLTLGGNYTYAVEHGLAGTDGLNYYNYRDEKLKLGLDPSVWGPTDALISRSQMLNMYLSYLVPMGKGNVSGSILGKYYNQGQRSLVGYGNLNVSNPDATLSYKGMQLPVVAVDGNSGQNLNQQYAIYYGAPNAFTSGSDIFALSMKLQAQIPLGKVMFLTEVMIDNPFNRINRSGIYDWGSNNELGSDGVANTPVSGRPLAQFNRSWGYADNHNYYDGGRTFSFNVGLKF